jgi:YVTN family beta-propeller protein
MKSITLLLRFMAVLIGLLLTAGQAFATPEDDVDRTEDARYDAMIRGDLTGLAGTLQAIDLGSGSMTSISLDAEPLGIDVDPRGTFVYVTCYGAGEVQVIDARTNAVVATISVANEPRSIAISPDSKYAYVTHSSAILTVIDLQRAGVPAS